MWVSAADAPGRVGVETLPRTTRLRGSVRGFNYLHPVDSYMDVRDAVEADAERLAELTEQPADVMRNLVHDRTVRVAVEPVGDDEGGEEPDEEPTDSVLGFVSYDAQNGTVHVTQIEGTTAACERLLEEPARFAESEGMPVELLIPYDEDEKRDIVEAAGFREKGDGPRFGDTPTVRYRLKQTRIEQ
jgi:hypothetical protein